MYSNSFKNLKKTATTPIVKNMIAVWQEVKKHLKETSSVSCFSPIWGNGYFIPGKADGGFKMWADKGVGQLKDVFGRHSGNLLSFEELVAKYDIPREHFFENLQLRSFIGTS